MQNIKRTKFNVSILGESTVGKTSMCSVYLGNKFTDSTMFTIGLESTLIPIKFDGKQYKFKIFDTAGQERYRSISKSTINIADGFLLVYAVDNIKTYETLEQWIQSIKEKCDINKKVLILVGNKIDKEKREVTKEEASLFAKNNNIKYFETSAKDGTGIKEIFSLLFEEVYKKYIEIEKLEKEENEKYYSKESKTPTVTLDDKEINKKTKKNKDGKNGGFC